MSTFGASAGAIGNYVTICSHFREAADELEMEKVQQGQMRDNAIDLIDKEEPRKMPARRSRSEDSCRVPMLEGWPFSAPKSTALLDKYWRRMKTELRGKRKLKRSC